MRPGESEMHYCTACDWITDADEERRGGDCTRQAIRHYLETEHMVVHQSFERESVRFGHRYPGKWT